MKFIIRENKPEEAEPVVEFWLEASEGGVTVYARNLKTGVQDSIAGFDSAGTCFKWENLFRRVLGIKP